MPRRTILAERKVRVGGRIEVVIYAEDIKRREERDQPCTLTLCRRLTAMPRPTHPPVRKRSLHHPTFIALLQMAEYALAHALNVVGGAIFSAL